RLPSPNPNPGRWGRASDRLVRRHRKGSVSRPSRLSFGLISTRHRFLDQLFQAVAGRLSIAITGGRRSRLGVSLLIVWFILLESLQDGVLGVISQERHQPIAGSLQHHPGLRPGHPIGPLLVRNQPAEKQERDDDDQEAASQSEQEAERAI